MKKNKGSAAIDRMVLWVCFQSQCSKVTQVFYSYMLSKEKICIHEVVRALTVHLAIDVQNLKSN